MSDPLFIPLLTLEHFVCKQHCEHLVWKHWGNSPEPSPYAARRPSHCKPFSQLTAASAKLSSQALKQSSWRRFDRNAYSCLKSDKHFLILIDFHRSGQKPDEVIFTILSPDSGGGGWVEDVETNQNVSSRYCHQHQFHRVTMSKKYKYPSISDQSEQGVDRRARRRWWSRGGELGSQGLGGGLNVTRMVVMVIIDDDGGQRILKMMLCSLGWGRSSGWRELSKSFWGLNHIFSIFILIHHLGFHVYPLQPKQTIMKSLKTIITKS